MVWKKFIINKIICKFCIETRKSLYFFSEFVVDCRSLALVAGDQHLPSIFFDDTAYNIGITVLKNNVDVIFCWAPDWNKIENNSSLEILIPIAPPCWHKHHVSNQLFRSVLVQRSQPRSLTSFPPFLTEEMFVDLSAFVWSHLLQVLAVSMVSLGALNAPLCLLSWWD